MPLKCRASYVLAYIKDIALPRINNNTNVKFSPVHPETLIT